MPRLIVWFVLGAAVVGALARILGGGPERVRALLLFPLAFGLLAGTGLAFTAREFRIRPVWLVTVLSCLLVGGGLVLVAWEAYRELVVLAQARVREDAMQLWGLRLLEDQQAADPAFRRQFREQRMALDPQFDDYLMGRVSALGIWRPPWPMVIWVSEVLLATAAAGWLVQRVAAPDVRADALGADETAADSSRDESEDHS